MQPLVLSAGLGLAFGLAGLAALAGCATVSLPNQEFQQLRSPHFEILSSLGTEPTLELARKLELMHRGIEYALLLPASDAAATPARVLAFDDRSLTRPFALRDGKAYAVPTLSTPLLVLRTPDAAQGDATRPMSLEYAHQLMRRRDPVRRPLWFEVGLCEFASTVEAAPPTVSIGRPVPEHLQELGSRMSSALDSTFEPGDVSEWSEPARKLFSARAWAIVHFLALRDAKPNATRALARYREALDAQQRNPIPTALGDPVALADAVDAHAQRQSFDVIGLRRSGWQPDAAQLSRVAPANARTALGELALALERPALAQEYFERALRADPAQARAQRGLAAALRQQGLFEQAAAQLERALALAPDDALTQLESAELALARAQDLSAASERSAAAAAARDRYRDVLQRAPNTAAAALGIARSFLIEGQQTDEARSAIARARALAPDSLEVDLVEARVAARLGRSLEAKWLASEVWARSQWPPTRSAAREILDAL